ncbi:MAG: hypothetical protein KF729_14615 [Sandaracinaceae bacterium]|nr:hypothetical protein [Sandaracinaceae bacterium]
MRGTLGVLALLALGCGGSAPAPVAEPIVAAPAPAEPAAPDEASLRRAMLDRLLADIRRYHVFSEHWPRETWESDDVPRLTREVLDAPDSEALSRALLHVAHSLRDGHLTFLPAHPASRGIITLPLGFVAVGGGSTPRFVVDRADPSTGLAAGDELVTYDGRSASELSERFRYDLRAGPESVRAAQLANVLQWRQREHWASLDGAAVPLVARRADGTTVETTVRFAPYAGEAGATDLDTFRVADEPVCDETRARDYGPYRLVAVGARVCLYRASEGAFARFPLVRHHSFAYSARSGADREDQYRLLQVDHDLVRDFLARTPRLAGVILDLRDNAGGNNAAIFLDWYGREPYVGGTTEIRLHPELRDRGRLEVALYRGSAVDEYLRRAAAGERWWVRADRCNTADCPEEIRHSPAHRVTRAPIAALVGPGCVSACDDFARLFAASGAGPVIGTTPASALTAHRYPLEVVLGEEVLGHLLVAISRHRFGREGPWLEGRPHDVDRVIEPSWPLADYERAVREAALDALSTRPRRAGDATPRRPREARTRFVAPAM